MGIFVPSNKSSTMCQVYGLQTQVMQRKIIGLPYEALARASFGVRGIRILLNGIPKTTPDGQSQIDHLPLHLIRQSEVIRGPAGSRHGNAAGGVLSFYDRQ